MGTFATIMWVTIVALLLMLLVRWGYRTTRSVGGVAIAAAALIWAWVRPDEGGWFLYRPIGADWTSLIFVLLIVSLVVAFFMWRLAKLIGWISLIIAVLAPFWDLFTARVWGDLPGKNWLWGVILLVGIAGLLVLLFSTRVGQTLLAAAVALAILVAGWSLMIGSNDHGGEVAKDQSSMSSAPSSSPTATVTTTVTATSTATGPSAEKIADAVVKALQKQGFQNDEWTAHVDWREHVVERRSAFTNQTLKTQQDVYDFLAGSSQGSRLARQQALEALGGRPVTDCYYVPVQFNIPVQYQGNTYMHGAKIITPDGLRQAKPGDVIWLCVLDGDTVNWGASIRADCGNVRFVRIIPVRPHTPPAPPVTCVHKCKPPKHHKPPKCVEIPNNGVYDCGGKNPAQEPAQQGNVPTQVTGKNPGTGGKQASQPSATPSPTYVPPKPPSGNDGGGSGSSATTTPPRETAAPAPESPEPSPTQDPCLVNPDWC